MSSASLGWRAECAVAAARAVNAVSRELRLGSGTVIGGRTALAIDSGLLERLAGGRSLALVSGTNGKTTTTRLLAEALGRRGGPVLTNATGANMPAGHVAALLDGPERAPAVLEVDEGYLPGLVGSLGPQVVLLLNLSRDQLDRTNEVRMLAGRWRQALSAAPSSTVVANADDPLVVWGASGAARRRWVGAGLRWHLDAVGCPACGGQVEFGAGPSGGWSCECGFRRPAVDVELEGSDPTVAVWADGRRIPVRLAIPGRFNEANAVMAAAAAEVLGVPAAEGLEAMSEVTEVAGRFTRRRLSGIEVRLMLAKNPAGWLELLELLAPGRGPVVVGINARVADGRDPSWLWDVPFERLAGRTVVATGERCRDLSVRLRYAEVEHQTVGDLRAAVRAAAARDGTAGDEAVEFVGNYTAFHDLLRSAG